MLVREVVLFDLDGTLVDTAPVCALVLNAMLADRGAVARLTPEEARRGGMEGRTVQGLDRLGVILVELVGVAQHQPCQRPSVLLAVPLRKGLHSCVRCRRPVPQQLQRHGLEMCRGYECLVVADCVGSYFPEFHDAGLRMIKAQGGIFGWVAPSEAVIAALSASGS